MKRFFSLLLLLNNLLTTCTSFLSSTTTSLNINSHNNIVRRKSSFLIRSETTSGTSTHNNNEEEVDDSSQQQQNENSNTIESSSSSSDAALLQNTLFSDDIPNLPQWLEDRCSDCGWKHPTVIQQRAWRAIVSDGNDVVLRSQTGSGKTLAFLVPLLAKLEPRAAIQAVIVVPTRELGLQVGRVAKRLTAKQPLTIMNVLQGSSNKRQRAWAWAEPPQVVIGTPTELTDMVRYGGIKYNAVKYVVVDEVDACLLDNGGSLSTNAGPLHLLLSKHLSPTYINAEQEQEENNIFTANQEGKGSRPLVANRQTVFCSATIPQHRHFLKQCVKNQWTVREPVFVCANPKDILPPTLTHTYLVASSKEKKVAALRRFLKKNTNKLSKVLIFCEPTRPMTAMAQIIAKDLDGIVWQHGYDEQQEKESNVIVSVLRYEDSIADRAAAMLGFQGMDGGVIEGRKLDTDTNDDDSNDENNKIRILLSTDHAARGLDVEDISHVIQFDLPREADTYVHRSGRAGRLGRDGNVLTILTSDQEFVLERMTNKLGLQQEIHCIGRQQKKKKKN